MDIAHRIQQLDIASKKKKKTLEFIVNCILEVPDESPYSYYTSRGMEYMWKAKKVGHTLLDGIYALLYPSSIIEYQHSREENLTLVKDLKSKY